jgi:hypothetical protein
LGSLHLDVIQATQQQIGDHQSSSVRVQMPVFGALACYPVGVTLKLLSQVLEKAGFRLTRVIPTRKSASIIEAIRL